MIVYHGTTQRAARRIQREGFQPRPPSRRVWFAQSRAYAQQRARTKGRRAKDRAVVLTCNVDVAQLRQRLGSRRVMRRGGVIAVSGPIPASVLRSHGILGIPSTPEELVLWVNRILDIRPHKGPGRRHPGILRLALWVENRIATNPNSDIDRGELLSLAQQWLPEFFAGVEVDFERLRTLPRAIAPEEEEEPAPPPWEEEQEDTRAEEAVDCLEAEKESRRRRGLELLAELEDPDLFDWCAMFLEDPSVEVRVQALKSMRQCEEIEAEIVEPLTGVEEKNIRAAAIEVLAIHGGEEAGNWFWKGITDPEPHVRLTTARHLERLEPEAHREIYESALYDPHPEVARIAQKLARGKGFSQLTW